jgi:Transglycosylase SLT domain
MPFLVVDSQAAIPAFPSRMGRFFLFVIIATVAAIATKAGAGSMGGPPASASNLARLMHDAAASSEIVRFADFRQAPVRIVRGKRRSASAQPTAEVLRGELSPRGAAAVERGGAVTARAAPEIVRFAGVDPRTVTILTVTVLRGIAAAVARDPPAADAAEFGLYGAPGGAELDRIAFAVDGIESSHGADPGMWRGALDGPQGPMQVSAAAASDSGGGDRFDLAQNRLLGRTYLARLYRRYGNWADAVAAYNWGPGNLDEWISEGRPAAGLPLAVERYRQRVEREGGLPAKSGLGAVGR